LRSSLRHRAVESPAPATPKARGAVVFVDEAYELRAKGGENDFGPIALAQIMDAMDAPDGPLIILGGYERDIAQLLELNPGLPRRFSQHFVLGAYRKCQENIDSTTGLSD